MDYEDYEKFISLLVTGVKNSGRIIEDLNYGRENRIIGISGQKHQIDVSFIDKSFPETTFVLIECKRKSKDPVELAEVKVLKATLDDIIQHPNHPNECLGIFVTTSYFRNGTQVFAEYYHIKTEPVGHGLPYRFQYENIVQLGLPEKLCLNDTVIVVERKCSTCNSSLVPSSDGQTFECPVCS